MEKHWLVQPPALQKFKTSFLHFFFFLNIINNEVIDNLYPGPSSLALTFHLGSHKVTVLTWTDCFFLCSCLFWSTLKMCYLQNRSLCLRVGCTVYVLNCSSFSFYLIGATITGDVINKSQYFQSFFLQSYLRIVLSKHNVWDLLLDYFLSFYHDKQMKTRVGTEDSHTKFS